MDIELESGIPIPPRARGRHPYGRGALKHALTSMEIGASFLYPRQHRESIYNSAKHYGVAITIRTEDVDFVRVWRVG